jgi:sRNA-binding regulator protein Hfq
MTIAHERSPLYTKLVKNKIYELESLTLTNSHVFNHDIDIYFDKKITIIQSPNGGYKTTLFNSMRGCNWPYGGEFKLKLKENSSTPIFLNLIYADEEWLSYRLSAGINHCSELNKSEILKETFLENLNKVNDSLCIKRSNIFCLQDKVDPFDAFSLPLATGEKTLLNIAYLGAIREFLGVDGAIILDGGLAMMDRHLSHIAYKMLTSMTNQLVIFSHPTFFDFDYKLINLDQDDIKIITLDPNF